MHACAIKFAFSSALMIFFHPSPSQGLFERLYSSQKRLTDTPTPSIPPKGGGGRLENTKVDFRRLRKKGGEKRKRLDQGLVRIMGSGKRQLPKKHRMHGSGEFFVRKCIGKYFIIIFFANYVHFVSPIFYGRIMGLLPSFLFSASASDKRFPAFLLRKCFFFRNCRKGNEWFFHFFRFKSLLFLAHQVKNEILCIYTVNILCKS